jgi:hypothetical protein
MIAGILQINANLVFCFRAKEKTRPKSGGGIQELGFMPIAGEELLFEMTVNCLLMPKSNGVPTWRSDQIGERMMMKLPVQFQNIFAAECSLDESIGSQLAAWAKGSTSPPAQTETAAPPEIDPEGGAASEDESARLMGLNSALADAAKLGSVELRALWATIPASEQKMMKASLDRRHKPAAAAADERAGTSS